MVLSKDGGVGNIRAHPSAEPPKHRAKICRLNLLQTLEDILRLTTAKQMLSQEKATGKKKRDFCGITFTLKLSPHDGCLEAARLCCWCGRAILEGEEQIL